MAINWKPEGALSLDFHRGDRHGKLSQIPTRSYAAGRSAFPGRPCNSSNSVPGPLFSKSSKVLWCLSPVPCRQTVPPLLLSTSSLGRHLQSRSNVDINKGKNRHGATQSLSIQYSGLRLRLRLVLSPCVVSERVHRSLLVNARQSWLYR
jgi:hypothetical protein